MKTWLNIPVFLLTTNLLSGCIPAAFVAGGAATGAVLTEPRTWSTVKKDTFIRYWVNKALMEDTELTSQAHVSATVYNRVVLLTGQVLTEELIQQAERDTRRILKKKRLEVTRIFNQIMLAAPTSPLRRSKDVAITSAVRTRLLAEPALRSNHFKVVTEDGVVFILGVATSNQADRAVSVVQHTPGIEIKGVVRLIEIKKA
jgi:osmotically-inducible protein OsmY